MKYIYNLLFVGLLSVTAVSAQADNTEHSFDFQKYVPTNQQILFSSEADLNADGLMDAILVTESKTDPKAVRNLQILRNTGKGYQIHQNSKLIPCKSCGGSSEEPTLRNIQTHQNGFSVQIFYGGIKNTFLKTFEFNYAKSKRNWFLRQVDKQVFNSLDPEETVNTQSRSYRQYHKNRQFERISQFD